MSDFTRQMPVRRFSFSSTLSIVVAVIVVGGLIYGAYAWYSGAFNKKNVNTNSNTTANTNMPSGKSILPKPSVVQASGFAAYKENAVNVKPSVPAYAVARDFSNVTNFSEFGFSDSIKNHLQKNAFVVDGTSSTDEYFALYERNRYVSIPNFVTTDSLLHNYHLYYDFLLKSVEQDKLIPALQNLNTSMVNASLKQLDTFKGTAWENAAMRNVAFFTVGGMLLDPAVTPAPAVLDIVTAELKAITAHEGPAESAVMNYGETFTGDQKPLLEDYSQYIPRGHYTESDTLKTYFKAMMWYGRMTFRFTYADETRSAALVTLALQDPTTRKSWDTVTEPIGFFVGRADDVTASQLTMLLTDAYGKTLSESLLKSNAAAFDTFWATAKKFEPPAINSIPVFEGSIQPDRASAITGFRFLGQRFTVDASVFQRLLCRDVGNQHGTMECGGSIPDSRMLPNGLDIPAAFGSKEATAMLTDLGQNKYLRYPENLASLQSYTAGLPVEQWTQNLYWGWLYNLLPFTKTKYAGFPSFMLNDAWQKKELATFLGSWAELKHDTILYAKQAYAELGGGGSETKDDRGYVEPNPQVYGRLASLIQMTSDGLTQRALLSDTNKESLSRMRTLALSLKSIAEKELENKALAESDYALIRTYGGELEHFWLEVNEDKIAASGLPQNQYLMQNPAAIIADVATDPGGHVLEVGTGPVRTISVVVPVDGKLRIAQGGAYSYYEFPWPLSDRLTDEAWRTKLTGNDPPQPADWTAAFTSSTTAN